MDEKMRQFLKAAEKLGMSSEEMEDQRRSFAYGNAHLSNPNVTREMIDEAAEELDILNADNFEERYREWVSMKFAMTKDSNAWKHRVIPKGAPIYDEKGGIIGYTSEDVPFVSRTITLEKEVDSND